MAKTAKTPVFFIATRYQNNPVQVDFYTKDGGSVSSDAVKKVPTKKGVRLYAEVKK